jgi:hypothetical protein
MTSFSGVWGSAPNDAWIVGGNSGVTLLHWDGTAWSIAISPTLGLLEGVWGSGPDDVWAVGSGVILHHS